MNDTSPSHARANVQVTASGLPVDFVARCWELWASDTGPMNRGKDCLTLVTRGRNNAFMATWTDLKDAAAGSDPVLSIARMRVSAKHRKMFESVRSPAKKAGVTVADADVVAMVSGMAVVPLDFQIAGSESEKNAVAQARRLLVNGTLTEGGRLWKELISQARTARLGTGTLEISNLWRQLRSAFVLKDHPDYEASWKRLRALTHDYRATIETALPSGVVVDRQDQADKVFAVISTDAVSVVFGESGNGKSALVKSMLDEKMPQAEQMWFGPDEFGVALNEATRESIGINQLLIELLDATAKAENIPVIDAAERLNQSSVL